MGESPILPPVPQRIFIAALAAGLLAFAGCGGSDDNKAKKTTAATTPVATTPATTETAAQAPTLKVARGHTYTAEMITNFGEIDIRLDAKHSPKTVASFVSLARKGFYDKLTFHRISRSPSTGDFVIQGGDPEGTGQGGPGYSVVEAPPQSTRYTRGLVAMAKTQAEAPGTSGSQFFIVTAEDAGLPPEYAVLGRVIKGMNAVKAISATPTGPASASDPTGERPRKPVTIRQVKIVEKRA
jgi:cyclophilin family peptidyl-prolyl cis-trans isomerase